MNRDLSAILKNRLVNGWCLFSIVTGSISVAVLIAMTRVDLSRGEEISSLIQLSVRCSVPWLYLAFVASSLHSLAPGALSLWLMRNRRIVGLCFAGGMAWQLTFILWLVIGFSGYYADEVYLLADIIVQVPGYFFLIAMTWTSFSPARRRLTAKQWRTLHKVSIYFLWGTVWSTYWYELYYYGDVQLIDYIYYWTGFLVWGLRLIAWSRARLRIEAARGAG